VNNITYFKNSVTLLELRFIALPFLLFTRDASPGKHPFRIQHVTMNNMQLGIGFTRGKVQLWVIITYFGNVAIATRKKNNYTIKYTLLKTTI